MPDPNAHADDIKSPDNYVPTEYVPPPVKDKDTLPPLWWLNPWNTVLALLYKVDHLKATSRGEQAARIDALIARSKSDEAVAKLLIKCDDYAKLLAQAIAERDAARDAATVLQAKRIKTAKAKKGGAK
jgi:hypothetical protein